jgi:hypothetical protein
VKTLIQSFILITIVKMGWDEIGDLFINALLISQACLLITITMVLSPLNKCFPLKIAL